MLPSDYVQVLASVLKGMEDESAFGLRGWLKHLRSQGDKPPTASQQDELAITDSLCKRFTSLGFPSRPERYPHSNEYCDIVSRLPNRNAIWIEAKVYYTVYFDDKDLTYSAPRMAGGSHTWNARIRALRDDCVHKLRMLPNSEHVAGLLIGFETYAATAGASLPPRNPSMSEVEKAARAALTDELADWQMHLLAEGEGWERVLSQCPAYRFVTRPVLWTPK